MTQPSSTSAQRGCIATDPQLTAAKRCDFYRIPFILYALPGEDHATFFADSNEDEVTWKTPREAVITEYEESCREDASRIVIHDVYSAEEIANSTKLPPAPRTSPCMSSRSTPAVSYMARVHEVAASLGRTAQKAVIARIIAGTVTDRLDNIAERLFAGVTQTLRFMFYTPQTGLWLGSTPELLLSSRHAKDGTLDVRTVALAGTLPADSDEPWDSKNIKEQSIVEIAVDYMVKESGANDITTSHCEKVHGPVKHLCTEISAKLPADYDPQTLETRLHPTPAVLGFPPEKAYDLIERYENISRRCYSGVLTVVDDMAPERRRDSYVMLRCAMLGERGDDGVRTYNIYTGGGILHSSKPELEWDETARKALPMLSVITGEPIEALPVIPLFDQIDIENRLQETNPAN